MYNVLQNYKNVHLTSKVGYFTITQENNHSINQYNNNHQMSNFLNTFNNNNNNNI